ncbi:MAG: ABC transporter substrate-binding protein [Deltaproteobacteria bacterium]|nr:ABC transporter substrate-binding protein [Deltaproteobacteria bacterium]
MRTGALLTWWIVLPACSLTTLDYTECTGNAVCREAFGLGSVCGEEGFCEGAPPNLRCDQTTPPDLLTRPEDHPDVIVFGSLVDRAFDVPVERAFQLAMVQVNQSGGLEQSEFGLVACNYEEDSEIDSFTQEEAALDTATYLVDVLGTPVLLGPSTSVLTGVVWAEVSPKGVVVVSSSATSPALTYIDGLEKSDENPGTLWRTAAPDSLQGRAIAVDLRQLGVTTVAVVRQDGAYGEGLAQVFLDAFQDGTHTAVAYPWGTSAQRDEAVASASLSGVEVVLFISSELLDGIAFLNAAAVLSGYEHVDHLYLTDGAADIGLLEATTAAAPLYPKVRGTRPSLPEGDVYEAFRASYAAAYTDDPANYAWTAHSYDAAWLGMYGAAWSLLQEGAIVAPGIGRGLRRLSSGAPIDVRPGTWTDVLDEFGDGRGIDLTGASGDLDFDPATEETEGPVDVWEIDADALVTIGTCYPNGVCEYP